MKLDLLQESSWELIDQMLASGTLFYVHAAPPCGTASRARLIHRPGFKAPPPVRSDECPDGLSHLTGSLAGRVASANKLYSFTSRLCQKAWDLGIFVSVENPGHSFMWSTSMWAEHTAGIPLIHTFFHHCCHGGSRRKLTRLVHNMPALTELEAFCPGESESHKHLAWGFNRATKSWNTSEETAYPVQLCRTWAHLLVDCAKQMDVGLPDQSLADRALPQHRAARVALDVQSGPKKLPPLVKEFKQIGKLVGPATSMPPTKITAAWHIPADVTHDLDSISLPAGSRVIRTQFRGVMGAVCNDSVSDCMTDCAGTSFSVGKHAVHELDGHGKLGEAIYIVGIPWEPQEFVMQACKSKHPRFLLSGVPAELQKTVSWLSESSDLQIGSHRSEEMRRWVTRARDLVQDEMDFKAQLQPHCSEILASKRLLLFQELTRAAGHQDTDLVRHMSAGFKLAGPIPRTPGFRKRRTSAGMTERDLLGSAPKTRKAIILSTRSSGDPALDEALYTITESERDKGWLSGPHDEKSLEQFACVSRRFGVMQNGKCRPIDNLLESGINSTTSAEDTINVHTVDIIVAGVVQRLKEDKNLCAESDLRLRSWDLAKAYKQLPVHSDSLRQNYLVVHNPRSGRPEIYGQRVLPFGSRSSVHGFVRTAAAIWAIGLEIFQLHWNVYFDDFIVFERGALGKLTELCVFTYFSLLGWGVSAEKGESFSTVAKVLGLEINLGEAQLGFVVMQNTQSRRVELCSQLEGIIAKGSLGFKECAKLRGRLVFAENQLFGRRSIGAMRSLSRHMSSGSTALSEETRDALSFLRQHLLQGPPRRASVALMDTMHVYVDASFETANTYPGGLGGVLVETRRGTVLGHFSLMLSPSDVATLTSQGKRNPIFELECWAMLAGLFVWRNELSHKHLVVFTDNNGSLGAMISGISKNDQGFAIIQGVERILDVHGMMVWFERVNTASNLADEPSRNSECPLLGARHDLAVTDLTDMLSL